MTQEAYTLAVGAIAAPNSRSRATLAVRRQGSANHLNRVQLTARHSSCFLWCGFGSL